MKYYRIVIDFSHNVGPEAFQELFNRVVESVMKELDPHEKGPDDECQREVWVIGKDVTHEYSMYQEGIVEGFRQELDDPNVVSSFIEGGDE